MVGRCKCFLAIAMVSTALLITLAACTSEEDPSPVAIRPPTSDIPATKGAELERVADQVRATLIARPTPKPLPTYTPYPTPTPRPAPAATPTLTPTPMPTATPTPKPVPTAAPTPTPVPTATPTPTPLPTHTYTCPNRYAYTYTSAYPSPHAYPCPHTDTTSGGAFVFGLRYEWPSGGCWRGIADCIHGHQRDAETRRRRHHDVWGQRTERVGVCSLGSWYLRRISLRPWSARRSRIGDRKRRSTYQARIQY